MSSSLKNLSLYHIFVYFGTFMVYASLHGLRAGWSYSKTATQAEFGVSKDFLGVVDALYLACYSAGFAIMGSLIHRFSLKYYVIIGLTMSSLSYMIWIVIYATTGFYN
jgi:sugar phosphate permease